MDNLGFHKSKLYSLILAGVGLIALFLPWFSLGGWGSKNGLGSWGLLFLVGIGVVAASCFMGDKSKPYDEMGKKLVLGGFGAMAASAVIYLIRIMTAGGGGAYGVRIKLSPGIGLFLGLAVAVIGLLLALGKISVPKSIDDKVK